MIDSTNGGSSAPSTDPSGGRGRLLVVSCLVALLLVAIWLSWRDDGLPRTDDQRSTPPRAQTPVSTTPPRTAPAALADPELKEVPVAQVAPEKKEWKPPVFAQGVRVHVTDLSSRPVAGATVLLEYGGAGRLACDPATGNKYDLWPAFLKTDDSGVALFRLPYDAGVREPTLKVCADGFAAAEAHVSTIPEGVFVDVVVPLEPGWVLQGWVRGVDPKDLSDIEVECYPNPGLPEVEDPAPRELMDKKGPYKEMPVDEWMDAIAKWSESHPQNEPAPDHDYEVLGKKFSYAHATLILDDDGGFRFPCAPKSGASLSVYDPYGRYRSVKIDLPPGSPPVTVQCMKNPESTSGKVSIIFPPDHPGSRYSVSFRSLDPSSTLEHEPRKYDYWNKALYKHLSYPYTLPMPGSPFDFDVPQQVWRVPAGAWTVTVTGIPPPAQWPKAPHQNELATFTVNVEKGGEYTINPEFHRGARISGKVLDSKTGEGLWQIHVTLVDPDAGAQADSVSAITGPDGAFILIGVTPGKWEFSFGAGNINYDEARQTLVADADAPTADVVVKLNPHVAKPRPGTITGQVVDAASGAPIPWASLYLDAKTPQLNQSLSGSSGPTGSFELSKVQPGRWKLVVKAKAYQAAEEWVTSSEAAPTEGVIVRMYREP